MGEFQPFVLSAEILGHEGPVSRTSLVPRRNRGDGTTKCDVYRETCSVAEYPKEKIECSQDVLDSSGAKHRAYLPSTVLIRRLDAVGK